MLSKFTSRKMYIIYVSVFIYRVNLSESFISRVESLYFDMFPPSHHTLVTRKQLCHGKLNWTRIHHGILSTYYRGKLWLIKILIFITIEFILIVFKSSYNDRNFSHFVYLFSIHFEIHNNYIYSIYFRNSEFLKM